MDRIITYEPMPTLPGSSRCFTANLDVDNRHSGLQSLTPQWLQDGREVKVEIERCAPQVALNGEAVDGGESLIDACIAQPLVKETHPYGRGRKERVQESQ
jgi:hypothetical protein